ncbi:hypothetical protein JOJ88_004554 [Pantoea cypripedii]|nr:hypothetical protein [Pantoea cypripedii]
MNQSSNYLQHKKGCIHTPKTPNSYGLESNLMHKSSTKRHANHILLGLYADLARSVMLSLSENSYVIDHLRSYVFKTARR